MEPNPILPLHGPLTLEQAIRQAAQAFESAGLHSGHGTDNALDEASWLLMHALNLPVNSPPDYAQTLSESTRKRCNQMIDRRIQNREPVAYITGTAWFAGHEFLCDERALVPRSPFAEFINEDFFGLFNRSDSVLSTPPDTVLDLCTGGGCIGISCALALPQAQVVCADLSVEALALARENIAHHDIESRVSVCQGDLFENVQGKFDLIISNPPYVDSDDLATMPQEFHAEPVLGLAAGYDGLDLVRVMIRNAPQYLTLPRLYSNNQ